MLTTIERRHSAFVQCRVVRPKFVPKDRDAREGVDIAKSTMCDWHKTMAELVQAVG